MFLLQNIVTNLVIFFGILVFLIMILLLIISIKKGSKKKIIALIIIIVVISPISINFITNKIKIAKKAKKIEKSIEKSLREEDYILLEKQLGKETLISLIKENNQENKNYKDIETKFTEENRKAALDRIKNAIKIYKQHHAEEQQKKKENIFKNDSTIYRYSEF